MALTLIEAMRVAPGTITRDAVIEEYAKSSDLLMALPFVDIQGNALAYNREDTLPGVGFRGVNEGYTESVGIVNPQSESLVIAGGDLDVDKFILTTTGESSRAYHQMAKVKALSLRITREIIKGDSTANPRVFDGMQRRVTGSQVLSAGSSAGGDALSLTMLDDLIDQVDGCTHLVMNKKIKNLLKAAARNPSIGGYISYSADEFGRQITSYQGIPFLIADYDEAGSSIMPFAEANPGGGTPASTSIYALALGEGKMVGLQNGLPSVRDLGELETKPTLRTRVEWFMTLCIMHGRAAARLQGIKNAAVVV